MGNRGYDLTGACPELHSAYDGCERTHLDAFRRGEVPIDNPCRDAWEDYKQCVMGVWDAKTQDYLKRRAAARGEPPPPTAHVQPTTAAASSAPPKASASAVHSYVTEPSFTMDTAGFDENASSSDPR